MIRNMLVLIAILVITLLAQSQSTSTVALYEGARLISGDGKPPIENSAMLVENGTITRVGAKGAVTAPSGARRIDFAGKTVMPTLINTHGHPGFQRGLTYDAANFTRETVMDDSYAARPAGGDALLKLKLQQAMDRLPEGMRKVLVLHDVEGYTHEEIGEMLGVNPGTCKSQLFKARAKMRKLLSPAPEFAEEVQTCNT